MQNQRWRNFYELAWDHRAEFMRAKIREGERDPYRIIKLLEALERKYILEVESGVTAAYERRTWAKELFGETPAGVPLLRGTSFSGDIAKVPFYARDNLHNFIIDYIDETGPYDCIVELGCGYGRALFEIFYGGGPRDIPYFGGEMAAAGVAIATELAALQPAMKASFFRFDHVAPDLSAVPRCERALVFTMHSIEQVTRIEPSYFRTIADVARRVTALHFEPFGWQVKRTGPVSDEHRKFMMERNWNLNFAEALVGAIKEYGLRCDYNLAEQFLPMDWTNPTSLSIWHSGPSEDEDANAAAA